MRFPKEFSKSSPTRGTTSGPRINGSGSTQRASLALTFFVVVVGIGPALLNRGGEPRLTEASASPQAEELPQPRPRQPLVTDIERSDSDTATEPFTDDLPSVGRGTRAPAATILPAADDVATTAPLASPSPESTEPPAPSVSVAPSEVAASTPPPAPPPPVVAGASACGPVPGTPAGWTRRVTSLFDETTPLGSWPGPVAAQAWRNRDAGATDSSGRGTYDSNRTVSEANGLLDVWIHSESPGNPGVHDPQGQRYVAAPVSQLGPTAGARITVCMRADVIPGYKLAYLLWPSDGEGNTLGEIDFPEGRLKGDGATARAFMHYAQATGDKDQDAYDSGVALQGWHAYTIEWNPRAPTPYVQFLVDGRLIGHSTQYVPTVNMFYVMQMETYLKGDELPAPAEGHVQIDWVTIDLPE